MAYTPPPGQPPPGQPPNGPPPWGSIPPGAPAPGSPPYGPPGYPPYGQPGYPPYGPPRSSGMPGYLIAIIVVVLIVPLLGILASLGIYGVRRYVQNAKTAEAKNTVGAIHRAAVASFERETHDGRHVLCGESSVVPGAVPGGSKYVPSLDDWDGDDETGWKCLKFSVAMPMYYQYQYKRSGFLGARVPDDLAFQAVARGDLDADGTLSLFWHGSVLKPNDVLVRMEQVQMEDEFE